MKQRIESTNLTMLSMTMKLCLVALKLIRLMSIVFIVKKVKRNLIKKQAETQKIN